MPTESGIIDSLRHPCYANPVISKSNSSYGNYSIKLSACTFKFFWKKKQAEEFLKNHLNFLQSK